MSAALLFFSKARVSVHAFEAWQHYRASFLPVFHIGLRMGQMYVVKR